MPRKRWKHIAATMNGESVGPGGPEVGRTTYLLGEGCQYLARCRPEGGTWETPRNGTTGTPTKGSIVAMPAGCTMVGSTSGVRHRHPLDSDPVPLRDRADDHHPASSQGPNNRQSKALVKPTSDRLEPAVWDERSHHQSSPAAMFLSGRHPGKVSGRSIAIPASKEAAWLSATSIDKALLCGQSLPSPFAGRSERIPTPARLLVGS